MRQKDILLPSPWCTVWRLMKKLLSITAAMFFISAAGPLMAGRAGCSHAGMSGVVRNVMVPMSDGVKLATDIYFPLPLVKSPVILIRTVYGKTVGMSVGDSNAAQLFSHMGYIVLVQDVRGRGRSGGDFYPFVHDGADGRDTIAWIRQKKWCNGRLGTLGQSFLGIAQWLEAPGQDIGAMCASFASPDLAKVMYRGGQLNLLTTFNWAMLLGGGSKMNIRAMFTLSDLAGYLATLPLDEADDLAWRDVTYFDDGLDAEKIFETIASVDVTNSFGNITAPLLSIAGWYDMFLGPQLLDFQRMITQGGGKAKSSLLIVGPWGHGASGDGSIEFDNATLSDAAGSAALMAWYDYWLRDKGAINAMPKVLLYVMGDNTWRSEEQWPLARAVATPYYLHTDGMLSEEEPQAGEPPDTYTYDPHNPVPTLGGSNLLTNVGPYDQQPVESRNDVLCYTTSELPDDIEVTGPISAALYAATDAADTDFTVKLVDVYPDDMAINIQDGIVRALYRDNDPLAPTPLTPGKIERYDIDLWATSIVFKKGHRIRIEVSSSNFPRYNRNLNTGLPVPDATLAVSAHQSIYHASLYPSHILLPVIPR
jgi:uncharacterized protein